MERMLNDSAHGSRCVSSASPVPWPWRFAEGARVDCGEGEGCGPLSWNWCESKTAARGDAALCGGAQRGCCEEVGREALGVDEEFAAARFLASARSG